MKAFITGGAGFIGSNLADKLLSLGHQVCIYDNLSTGQTTFIEHNFSNPNYRFVQADILDYPTLLSSMKGYDIVFHLQANADVRGGIKNTKVDFEQNIVGTRNVLEAIRENDIKRIAFASSATVYGEPEVFPTPENIQLIQTSLYGASKASAENMIQAYCEYFGIRSWTFRFVSFFGKRYTHGVIFDFLKKLKANPNELEILGDGAQRKSYLDVEDGINAILTAIEKAQQKVNIFNLGNIEYMDVKTLSTILCNYLGLKDIKFNYTGGVRGWVGDSPFVHLDITKIRSLGWEPKYSIEQGIYRTIEYLQEHNELLSKRKD